MNEHINPEKTGSEKKLTRWLLIATLALLVLVLCLQLWQIFGGERGARSPARQADSPGGAATVQDGVSPGKAAMIEDVRSLNDSLAFDDLAALSAEELEQLWETGAPGLPVGLSAAAYAAEAYAGALEVDAVTWSVDPELDESPAHYDVELHHITLGDYEYKVDAYTGEVFEGKANLFQEAPPTDAPAEESASAGTSAPPSQAASGKPSQPASEEKPPSGEEVAKAAALAHAGVKEADAVGLVVEQDWEDGAQIYDVSFYAGGLEYDYEVDAATGAVLKMEQEWVQHPGAQGGGFIGEEAAKQAALAHAGVSAAEAGYFTWEVDEDDGIWVYEIKFRSGGLEYEYEINAATGDVLKAEQDR